MGRMRAASLEERRLQMWLVENHKPKIDKNYFCNIKKTRINALRTYAIDSEYE